MKITRNSNFNVPVFEIKFTYNKDALECALYYLINAALKEDDTVGKIEKLNRVQQSIKLLMDYECELEKQIYKENK